MKGMIYNLQDAKRGFKVEIRKAKDAPISYQIQKYAHQPKKP